MSEDGAWSDECDRRQAEIDRLRAENARLNDRLTACETETVLLREERDRQYDENVNRIAKEGAAELMAEKAEADNVRLREALADIARWPGTSGDVARAALSQKDEPK